MAGMSRTRRWTYGVLTTGALGLAILGQPAEETATGSPVPSASASAVRPASARLAAASRSHGTLSVDAAAFLTRLAHRSSDPAAAGELFASHSWYVPPPAPPPAPPAPPPPPPAPVAPPLPFAFLGSFAADGDVTTYFLSRGDRIYDVKVGQPVDTEYSLDSADARRLVFIYKPLNTSQSLTIGDAQ